MPYLLDYHCTAILRFFFYFPASKFININVTSALWGSLLLHKKKRRSFESILRNSTQANSLLTCCLLEQRWIVVEINHITRCTVTEGGPVATAEGLADWFLQRIVLLHGAAQFLSDRSTPLIENLLQHLLHISEAVPWGTSGNHRQSSGLTERINWIQVAMISMYVDEDLSTWDDVLLYVTLAYNVLGKKEGSFSPHFQLYVRDPLPALDTVLQKTAKARCKVWFDDILHGGEESGQLARLCTYEWQCNECQQDQQLRWSSNHIVTT